MVFGEASGVSGFDKGKWRGYGKSQIAAELAVLCCHLAKQRKRALSPFTHYFDFR